VIMNETSEKIGSNGTDGEAVPPAAVIAAAAAADAAAGPAEAGSVAGDAGGGADAGGGISGGVDLAGELSDLGGLAVMIAAQRWPWVSDVWTHERVRSIGQAAAAVCAKHGWLQGGVSGGPEMLLAVALAGPVIESVQRIRGGDGGAG
jgi:hypothetical protein